MFDPEYEARRILRLANLDDDEVPGARRILQRFPTLLQLEKLPPYKMHGAEGECCRVGAVYRIFLRSDLSRERASFVALHELAHVYLDQIGHGTVELEDACDAIAAALLCPRAAFRHAVANHGRRWTRLGLDFGAEPSCVALRYHEVFPVPGVLVSPNSVRVRGPESFRQTADKAHFRALAKARQVPPGVRRERIHDGQRRILVSSA